MSTDNYKFVDQVGGDHYQGEYQHWDWANDVQLQFLLYAATKYIARLGGKVGEERNLAVRKAISYVEKDIVIGQWRRMEHLDIEDVLICGEKFTHSVGLDSLQTHIMNCAAIVKSIEDLCALKNLMESLIDSEAATMRAVNGTGNPEAGNYLSGLTNHPAPFGYDEETNA